MSINPGKKANFAVITAVNPKLNVYDLRWGYEDTVIKEGKIDEDTGQWVLTGEVKETDMCTYELHRFYEPITLHALDNVFKSSQRIPKVSELKAMVEHVNGLRSDSELPAISEEEGVEWAKKYMVKAIEKHDKSKDVEDFTINGIHIWLDHDLRGKVDENLKSCEAEGLEETVLRIEGMEFPVTTVAGRQMYYALLKYARETWNATEISRSTALNSISWDELASCEGSFKGNYPAKLAF